MTDAAKADPLILVKAQHHLGMVVGYALQSRELPLYRLIRCESNRHLDVHPLTILFRDELDLSVVKFPDGDAVSSVQECR